MRKVLIGSGFYATRKNHKDRGEFLITWLQNTIKAGPLYTILVDNSELGLSPTPWPRIIRVENNLGHSANQGVRGNVLMGWSMSWIITALIAYSENCDFVYKEQDCLAFGDWLPAIRRGRMACGFNSIMPCEQSLFYIERNFIPTFLAPYLGQTEPDNMIVTEDKMRRTMNVLAGDCEQFTIPFGRERPLTYYTDRPWYAQSWTKEELNKLTELNFI